jgi:MYXO-CTERM domain-containing protein
MRKALASGALALVLAFGGGTAAVAQTDTNSGTEQTTNDDGDRGRWGLLGLLGLTGLAGLARRDRRDPVADYRGTGTVGGTGR